MNSQQYKKITDGCTAAAYAAYALSDVATIYPITPIAEMGETAQKWGLSGVKNLMGQPMQVKEMESELGAAGATHGALAAGALATTFTASQGLLLMIPNMFKISGELLPAVFHVGTRSIATHALSIFGDHRDIMACRSTGFAFLASASVQETMDLGFVAHLAAIEGSVPVCHFFDGWRTSNEMSTISMIPYEEIRPLVNWDKIKEFRDKSLNPEHPHLIGSAQNPDVYFQNTEAANSHYEAFPAIVERQMKKIGNLTGRHYGLFDYAGAPDAEQVIIAMGSSTDVIEETVNYLNERGYRTGVIKVRLFRPFAADRLLPLIPPTVKAIAALDRTKEPGANGEPLYQDVAAAIQSSGRSIKVVGGRYGLSSKDFNPSMVKAVFDELRKPSPKQEFTVGINDDVTHLSLDCSDTIHTTPADTVECQFYGMGSDGTVGATKQAANIISDTTELYAQAYFEYSAKKSGGYTVSSLRFGPKPIRAEYAIEQADYIGCNKDTYVDSFPLLHNMKEGGIFVLNSSWTPSEMDTALPASLRREIALRKVRFYNVDATAIARSVGLGVRINVIMETVFLKLIGVADFDTAVSRLKELVTDTYMHEGGDVVNKNLAAIDKAVNSIIPVDYPQSWTDADDSTTAADSGNVPKFINEIARPCLARRGNELPVSVFDPSGHMPMGTTAYEKRRIAIDVPQWNPDKCVECTECSFVCPHAAIRPLLISADEKAAAPAGFISKPAHGPVELRPYQFRIQVYPEDCTGCGSCATICPGHALTMMPLRSQLDEQKAMLDYAEAHISIKDNLINRATINGSQFHQPLLQFSGACAGCGETPYVKLLTQLFGERMIIANATGCSSIWGANYPSNAYCTNRYGQGPAWGNSLFEDNAEYGYGMAVAIEHRRDRLAGIATSAVGDPSTPDAVKAAMQKWLDSRNDPSQSAVTGKSLIASLKSTKPNAAWQPLLDQADILGKKSVWAIGGDGWAYDIGFAGLDHVLAQRQNINILVMDTECYSNTGGQTSKATPLGSTAKYSADGKRTFKKDLGRMMMTYGDVYVASVCLGANYQQTINAMMEAEAYDGPSIIIAYCPCIAHGIRSGMSHAVVEQRNAVACGYWQMYRFNPDLAKEGKSPLTIDYPRPHTDLVEFINGEDRYADLKMVDPAEAAKLQPMLAEHSLSLYNLLTRDVTLHTPPSSKETD